MVELPPWCLNVRGVFRFRGFLGLALAKLEALDFAGRGLGKAVAKFDPARIFKG